MAHFAEIDESNIVIRVVVMDDDATEETCADQYGGGVWKKTSYNTRENIHVRGNPPFRKNFAGIGFNYDSAIDGFVPPQPFDSWVKDTVKGQWVAPVDYPNDGGEYLWNEGTLSWDARELRL